MCSWLLSGLQGPELEDAVESGLSAVNLLSVACQPVGKFSGGMRRRLSVAISFMGNPSVVYLDEPSSVRPCSAVAPHIVRTPTAGWQRA